MSTYYSKDVSLWLTSIFIAHDPGHLVTMVDFGICGSLINKYYRSTPCIWTLWRWTSIPTGGKRYINTRFHALYKNRRDREVSASWIPLTQNASALWLRSCKTESNRLLFVSVWQNTVMMSIHRNSAFQEDDDNENNSLAIRPNVMRK